MKKLWIIGAMLFASNTFAQTIDFESHLVSPETYDNGSLGGGDFTFDYLTFTNFYEDTWGSWNGFAISNITDNTTPGFMNQYASYPGDGEGDSEAYAVFYPTGDITVSNNGHIEGFSITNTAYAALSMRDGDGYGKQFGSIYAGDGVTVDGTNGEDFFRVWIIAEDLNQTDKDSVVFYLADYRFPDDNDDYIIDTWEYVDLTGLSVIPRSITFRFESSDMGQFGINTPTYFAIDDIKYSMPLTVQKLNLNQMRVYPNPANEVVSVTGVEGNVSITNIFGEIVYYGTLTEGQSIDISDLIYGMYIISVSNGTESIASEKLIIR